MSEKTEISHVAFAKGNQLAKTNGGGRPGHGLEIQITRLKKTLLDAIEEDCKKGLEKKLFWAEKFVNRLMPQELTGAGGEKLFPAPLLAGKSNGHSSHHCDKQTTSAREKD